MKKYTLIVFSFAIFLSLVCCEKFLDEKPDKKLVVPSTIQDAQSLINDTYTFNTNYPGIAEVVSNDLYWTTEDWLSLDDITFRNGYIWDFSDDLFPVNRNDWSLPYITVYISNVILEAFDQDKIIDGNQTERDNIYGQALFFRSYAFYNLLQLFAKVWDSGSSTTDLGISLRLSSNLNIPSTRATVDECYQQILMDVKRSSELLSETTSIKTHPTKISANALLARIYLNMGLYEEALLYAKRALEFNPYLLDYNYVNILEEFPFPQFSNNEVLLHTLMLSNFSLYSPTAKVNPDLFEIYDDNDLRKLLFFRENIDGSYHFRGSYNGNDIMFNGLTTSELYLIAAECYARLGDTSQSMKYLNFLLVNRLSNKSFLPFLAKSSEEALKVVLKERRKELPFRGIRWGDLRRLNKEPEFAISLRRKINGKEYILLPNESRYVLPIPYNVIEMSDIIQNME